MKTIAPFAAAYAPDDAALVRDMLASYPDDPALTGRIRERAEKFVAGIRQKSGGIGLEEFMQEYDLSTKEGLALMVMAEALLRVPDAKTQNALIEEKLGGGNWDDKESDDSWFLMAASWGIGLGAKIVKPGETPGSVLKSAVKRLGVPVIRTGARQAMQFLGHHFVLGQTIKGALSRAEKQERKGFRYSYDMLGEGARTADDAARYLASYHTAIDTIGKQATKRNSDLPDRPGLSVKLSALHPRYEAPKRERVLAELVPQVIELAQKAKRYNLNLTIDAEEADRLELSLEVIAAVVADPSLADWDGFGLAIQAYQKRAPDVIDWIIQLAEHHDRRFMVRLVKGAYWDTEIKRAQERGLDDFPVFSKKAATDLCFRHCAIKLLAARPRIFPQFATHNALTLAAILELAGDNQGFEFQRLHGMGETLYDLEMATEGVPARIYAPVGGHKDLLAYLVRRLLENSANSSFVAQVADDTVSMDELLRPPQEELRDVIAAGKPPRHGGIPLPKDIVAPRQNSSGGELGYRKEYLNLAQAATRFAPPTEIHGIVDHQPLAITAPARPIDRPAGGEGDQHGSFMWYPSEGDGVAKAMAAARAAFPAWSRAPVDLRSSFLHQYADLLEKNQDQLLGEMVNEAGKTIDDALAELREAIDFCRFYADEATRVCQQRTLPGPAGEENIWHMHGRGVFACISPWNFPLAIFLGQITAALAAGNCVVAKPAEQTPLIAFTAIKLMIEAGLPKGVVNLVLGDGKVGAALIAHPDLGGVVFTGSTQTARAINQNLAAKPGPIVPLIAETGGINAMIVDSTALPEQVCDDVINSAFKSAGQRCSALRVLYLQDDIADQMTGMIIGAAKEVQLGDPVDLAVDVGPIIDAAARATLMAYTDTLPSGSELLYRGDAPTDGTFFAPHIIALPGLEGPEKEVFGPVLHICRWSADQLDNVIAAINGTGYGLTFGVHSRLDTMIDYLVPRINAGNIYANRNMIGAVVGVQPFGGAGLSGTGPKAGGPNYLMRFCEEKTVSINTAAAGGNASLIALDDA